MRLLPRILSRSATSEAGPLQDSVQNDSPPRKVAPFLALPTEILYLLEEHLFYENAIALSLTCKSLYGLLFKRHKPLAKHNGREANLLRLLERDLPDHLSCPIHEKLYTWRKVKDKHFKCPQCSTYPGRIAGSIVICNKGCNYRFFGIFEAERRLLLRYAILGSEYGLSQRLLNHVCKRSDARRANEVRSQIKSGRLMLWRTHHFETSTKFSNWQESGVDGFNEPICVHTEHNMKTLVIAALSHARRWENTRDRAPQIYKKQKTWNWVCPTVFKCEQCSTDIKLRLHQNHTQWVTIRLDAYQDLGGLGTLTTSQRQVFGTVPWRQGILSDDELVARLHESLEQDYYRSDPLQQSWQTSPSPESTTSIDLGNACFLPSYTRAMLRHDPPWLDIRRENCRSDPVGILDFVIDEHFE